MKVKNRILLYLSLFEFALFGLWTVLVGFIDVKAIGPLGSTVGFATLNSFIHRLTGVHLFLYHITDHLSVIVFAFVFCFAILGLYQWIKRKNLFLVDHDILALGGFYIAVLAFFLVFELVAINYRPVLIEGVLEASYPSSTTMLALCVLPTAIIQLNKRIKIKVIKTALIICISLLTVFMVIARLISGVHWFSDIAGGVLLSLALDTAYYRIFSKCLAKR